MRTTLEKGDLHGAQMLLAHAESEIVQEEKQEKKTKKNPTNKWKEEPYKASFYMNI